MGLNYYSKAIFRQARRDPIVLIFLLLFIVVQVPYFLPDASAKNLETYSLILASVFFLPFTGVLLWPRPHDKFHQREGVFWKLLSLSFVFWWVVSMLFWLLPFDYWTESFDIITDSIFLSFYAVWLIAMSFAPHLSDEKTPDYSDRWLMGAAAVILILCLFLYFILIPSRLAPAQYESWVPSLLFYSGLDCILVVLFFHLAIIAGTLRWKVLYSMLAVSNIVFAALDLLEAMNYSTRFHWAGSVASDTLWNLPYLFLVVIVLTRHVEFSNHGDKALEVKPSSGFSLSRMSPIIMAAFILPVLHICLDLLGLLDQSTRRYQSEVVLASLVVFSILTIMENRSLRRVTARAKAQSAAYEAMRVKQEVSERAEKIKGQFLANVSHEIRTPMNGILGMSEVLLRGNLQGEELEHARLVKLSAQGMLKVVDDILDYSKFQAGQVSLTLEPFRLDDVVTHVFDIFCSTEKIKKVDMRLEFDDDVPRELEGDAARLRQVLINLISNAIKFTSDGEVKVHVSLVEKSGSNARVLCEVIDSGIGISEEAVDELFLPFSQGDESTSRKYGGSGLGLAISKRIVEAHSGKIGAFGQPGEGSVFWFEIPFRIAEVEVVAQQQHVDKTPLMGTQKRILLAEDDIVNQIVAVKQLEVLGQQVDVAGNGREVLEALDRDSYDLILMDCQMPELDGLQATRLIREKGYSKTDLPVIALTANVFDEDRERCIEAGMNDFIAKPVLLENLRKVLVNWL